MDQITITRKEFREKIVDNPEGYGIVRAMHKNPELLKGDAMRAFIEKLTSLMTLREIETDLFGPQE
jgi:hypothetical protein